MNAKLFSEAITEVDNKYYEEAATYDYRVDNEVDTYSRAFALRRKLKTVLIAAVIMALAFSTVAAAAYLYHVFIANRHTELPSYEVGAKVEPKTISAYALEELKVKPYQTYKATYGEAEKYLDVDLLISEQLENTIFGQGVDIQGSYLKGENPITSVTLYSRHDTGATMSGYIDMSVYVSIGTSDTYQQIAQILNPELMEKDAILSEYVSETNGIAAKFAVYDTIGRASAYFVNDGISNMILETLRVSVKLEEANNNLERYAKSMIAGMIWGWIDEWMRQGMPETPEEIVLLTAQLNKEQPKQ